MAGAATRDEDGAGRGMGGHEIAKRRRDGPGIPGRERGPVAQVPELGRGGIRSREIGNRHVREFVRAADARALDVACLGRIPRPTFVLPVGALP